LSSPCGKITVFRANADQEDAVLVKRVLGLPEVKIALRDSELFLNGVPQKEPYPNPDAPEHSNLGSTKVPQVHFFVMGDKRAESDESHVFGRSHCRGATIVGEVFLGLWPSSRPELF
jgi:signal peptidase I